MPDVSNIPQFNESDVAIPKYEYDTKKLVSYYKNAFKQIADIMAAGNGGLTRKQAVVLLQQIEFVLRDLNAKSESWCREVVTKSYMNGQATTLVKLGVAQSLKEAVGHVTNSMLSRQTVDSLVSDTFSDLLAANNYTDRKIKDIVRNNVADAMRLKAMQTQGRVSHKNEIVQRLTHAGLSKNLQENGWVGIVDKAGRRWDLNTYADMIVRTKLNQAWVEGARVEATEREIDLAVVSRHGAADGCGAYEGMVISLNGLTDGYYTYDALKGSGKIFHPNCRHKVIPLSDYSLLNERQRQAHESKMAIAKKTLGSP